MLDRRSSVTGHRWTKGLTMAEFEEVGQPAADESVSERKPSQRIVDRIAVWQQRTAMGKEVVSAALGVVIVLTTLGIAVAGVFWVHGGEGRGAVKDTLIFLSGLVGVILGYYFGSIPGESRADRAETEAVQARSSRDQLVAGVREVLAAAGVEAGPGARVTASGQATLSSQQVERLRQLLQGP
jgi:hypothetical protein